MTEIKIIEISLWKENNNLTGKVAIKSTNETTKHSLDKETIKDIIAVLQTTIGRVNVYDLH